MKIENLVDEPDGVSAWCQIDTLITVAWLNIYIHYFYHVSQNIETIILYNIFLKTFNVTPYLIVEKIFISHKNDTLTT